MIMRKLSLALLLLCALPAALRSDPVSPAEPKAPEIRAVDQGDKAGVKAPDGDKPPTFEFNAVITYAGGNRQRSAILLPEYRIASVYFQGGRTRMLREEISKVKSIEFRGWGGGEGKGGPYCHSAAVITLDDGSVFVCGPVELFKRFAVRRGNATYQVHTCFYREAPPARKAGRTKSAGKKGKAVMHPDADRSVAPHPDTVVGIRFTHDERKAGIEELLPLMLK